MAKRFTATDKWKDTWFFELDTKQRMFWLYLLDDCDSAGIWEKNFKAASFFVGAKLTEEWAKKYLGDRVVECDESKWFIPKFIKFQYGVLSENANPHKSVIKLLRKFGLFEGYLRVDVTLEEQEQEQDKEQDKDQVQDLTQTPEPTSTTVEPEIIPEPGTKSNPLNTFEKRVEEQKTIGVIVGKWNAFASNHGLALCEKVTSTRMALILQKAQDPDFDIDKILGFAARTPFTMGQNDIGYILSFDKLLSGDTAQQILEGAHPHARGKPKKIRPIETGPTWAQIEAQKLGVGND